MSNILKIQDHTYNLTTLSRPPFRLTHYPSNRTLSNDSECYLLYPPYLPILFPNGTLTSTTSCFSPVNGIEIHGILGLAFGLAFVGILFFSVLGLNRLSSNQQMTTWHGDRLSSRAVHYWQILTSLVALLSAFISIDVDRYPVLGLPMILQSAFFTCIPAALLPTVFEAVKHRRSSRSLWLNLGFYALDIVGFIILVPRSWSAVQMQRSEEQEDTVARPAMTDWRMKAGTAIAGGSLLFILMTMFQHRPSRSSRSSVLLLITIIPTLATISYLIASAWLWTISPYRRDTSAAWLYGLGYGPALLVLITLNVASHTSRNSTILRPDGTCSRSAIDSKPTYWTRSATHSKRQDDIRDDFAMTNLHLSNIASRNSAEDGSADSRWWWQKPQHFDKKKDDDASSSRYADSRSLLERDVAGGASTTTARRTDKSPARSTASRTSGRSLQARPQVVRSMLDI